MKHILYCYGDQYLRNYIFVHVLIDNAKVIGNEDIFEALRYTSPVKAYKYRPDF